MKKVNNTTRSILIISGGDDPVTTVTVKDGKKEYVEKHLKINRIRCKEDQPSTS